MQSEWTRNQWSGGLIKVIISKEMIALMILTLLLFVWKKYKSFCFPFFIFYCCLIFEFLTPSCVVYHYKKNLATGKMQKFTTQLKCQLEVACLVNWYTTRDVSLLKTTNEATNYLSGELEWTVEILQKKRQLEKQKVRVYMWVFVFYSI